MRTGSRSCVCNVAADEYEEILKSGGFYENGNIRLIACRNGREPAVTAHYLVDEHGVLVIASTEMMLASGNFNQKGLSVY